MVTGPLASHGLSYMTFSLSSLQISSPVMSKGDIKFIVSVHIRSTGHIADLQVIQAYTSLTSQVLRNSSKLMYPYIMPESGYGSPSNLSIFKL